MIRSVGVLIVVAAVLNFGAVPQSKAANAPGFQRVQIVAQRFSYSPASITLKKGEPVILELKSLDVPHGLRFRELHVEVKAPKGGTAEVKFTPDRDGDFIGHCSVFCGGGHGSMTLTLHVIG